jgi:hypothetical protein
MDTKEQTKREPLLSDAAIEQEVNPEDPNNYSTREYYESIGCKWVRDFYEAKITSGELRVVEEVEEDIYTHIFNCAGMHAIGGTLDTMNYCPGCGAKITKP